MSVIVACVRTGTKFGPEYVERLVRGVKRYSTMPCRFVCFTDRHETYAGVENHRVALPGWWAKMFVFKPEWRRGHRVVYLDLDTVIVNDIDPLLALDVDFATCRCFAPEWPCKYSSCAIVLGPDYGGFIYHEFMASRHTLMQQFKKFGDQRVMEHIDGSAQFLQDLLPPGFLAYHRDGFRTDASLLIFGGPRKPHNYGEPWVTEAWVA